MGKRSGLYPHVHVDAAGSGVVSQAGGVLLLETVRASGLDQALSGGLGWWRKPTAVHDPAKIVLDLAVSLALGGDCLADIAVLRAEPGVYGPVASDPTVSRLVDALAADVCTSSNETARFRTPPLKLLPPGDRGLVSRAAGSGSLARAARSWLVWAVNSLRVRRVRTGECQGPVSR